MPLEAPEVVGEGDLILHITTDKFFIESFLEQQVRKLIMKQAVEYILLEIP